MHSERRFSITRLISILTLMASLSVSTAYAACEDTRVALQILGSGGPFGSGRAAAGYLIWVDGVARVMVDAGGGTFTRFHEASAKVDDLHLLALSHFHPDHSAEVPALLWIQSTDLLVSGPTGSDSYPSTNEYVGGLFGSNGVFRAVTNGKVLDTVTIDVTRKVPTDVFMNESIRVRALGVPHGIVPAVGYRIDIGDVSVVFSSDQNGSDPAFITFASGADVLVVHLAVPETQSGFGADLHARPSVWGQIATDAEVGTLVLSHLSGVPPHTAKGEPAELNDKLKVLRAHYSGALVIGEDLMCVSVGPH